MSIERELFDRTELLVGREKMDRIGAVRVILFGVGGVGSWCAESLVRSGIRHLTIVDSDRVCVSNINRQLMATTKTVGEIKVDVLKARLEEINPDAEIIACQRIYEAETTESFHLESFDYIIDAIDSLENKAELIRRATRTNAVFLSSMGAALKLDPQKIRVAEFWKVRGCPLAAALRRKMRKGGMPAKKFNCVFSEELMENRGEKLASETNPDLRPRQIPPADPDNHDWNSLKARINGTFVHATAIFGFTLAGLVMQDVCKDA